MAEPVADGAEVPGSDEGELSGAVASGMVAGQSVGRVGGDGVDGLDCPAMGGSQEDAGQAVMWAIGLTFGGFRGMAVSQRGDLGEMMLLQSLY